MSNAEFYQIPGYDPFAHDNGQPPTAPAITYADSPTPGPATPVTPGPQIQSIPPTSHPVQQHVPAQQQPLHYNGPVSPVSPISQYPGQMVISYGPAVPQQSPPAHLQQYPPPVHHPPIAELDSTPTSTSVELQNLRPAFDDQKQTVNPPSPGSPAPQYTLAPPLTGPYQPQGQMVAYPPPSVSSPISTYPPSSTGCGFGGSSAPLSVSAVAPSTTTSTPTPPDPTKYHGPAGHDKGYKKKAKRAGCFGGALAIFCCCGAGICQAILEGCSDCGDCFAEAMT